MRESLKMTTIGARRELVNLKGLLRLALLLLLQAYRSPAFFRI